MSDTRCQILRSRHHEAALCHHFFGMFTGAFCGFFGDAFLLAVDLLGFLGMFGRIITHI